MDVGEVFEVERGGGEGACGGRAACGDAYEGGLGIRMAIEDWYTRDEILRCAQNDKGGRAV